MGLDNEMLDSFKNRGLLVLLEKISKNIKSMILREGFRVGTR